MAGMTGEKPANGHGHVAVGAKVMATDRFVGSVLDVLLGPGGGVAYLHVRMFGARAEERFVLGDQIRNVVGRTVWLRHTGRDVEATALRARPLEFGAGDAADHEPRHAADQPA